MDETEERMNKQLAEAAKRENVLVLRLSAREQELQDVAAVAVKYRQQQVFIFILERISISNIEMASIFQNLVAYALRVQSFIFAGLTVFI